MHCLRLFHYIHKKPPSSIILSVRVKPNSKLSKVVSVSEDFVNVSVKAQAKDGEANTAVI